MTGGMAKPNGNVEKAVSPGETTNNNNGKAGNNDNRKMCGGSKTSKSDDEAGSKTSNSNLSKTNKVSMWCVYSHSHIIAITLLQF